MPSNPDINREVLHRLARCIPPPMRECLVAELRASAEHFEKVARQGIGGWEEIGKAWAPHHRAVLAEVEAMFAAATYAPPPAKCRSLRSARLARAPSAGA